MQFDPSRRRALMALGACALNLPGCATSTTVLCPRNPDLSELAAPLTIDTHAHVFNGSDLQVKEFISQVVVGHDSELADLADFLGGLLQNIAWQAAPSAREEHRALDRYAVALQRCGDAAQLRSTARAAFQEGYARGRQELQAAAARTASNPATASVLGARPGFIGAGLGAAIKDLPETIEEFESRRQSQASVLGSQPHLWGHLQFVLHHFNHRHVNAIDYLTTYSPQSPRKVDLLLPSMVDYDWWLALGRPTATSLGDQVDLMSRISVLTAGRVHGFVAFCPLREVMTSVSGEDGESMRLVKRAVSSEGFVGVKLYPPMGFAPWGNSALNVWKGRPLPEPATQPGFGAKLDDAMRRLFDWCQTEEVPVMAHANRSNGPNDDFRKLAGAEHWARALDRFPGLRVSFGHFGDTDLEDHGGDRTRDYLRLMTSGPSTKGANVYGDSGYFAGVLTNPNKVVEVLRNLLSPTQYPVLAERLMYGTDWTMILPQKGVERYLAEFIGVMAALDKDGTQPVRGRALSDAFFGGNAAEFLGLRPGQATRKRLDDFYARHGVERPDWARKLGGAAVG